jgi:hypothetical protein
MFSGVCLGKNKYRLIFKQGKNYLLEEAVEREREVSTEKRQYGSPVAMQAVS